MPSRRTQAKDKPRNSNATATIPQRRSNGTFAPGSSGQPGGDAGRSRRALNLDTIREMHLAFRQGGRKAIMKVMTQQPAVFLKLLVLLVPRELEITSTGGPKGMSDEQLAAAVEAIEGYLARRRPGDDAKVIDASPVLPDADPTPTPPDGSTG